MNPCPFCGNRKPILRQYKTPNGAFVVVQCGAPCFAQGPRITRLEETPQVIEFAEKLATHRWNERSAT